MFIVVVWPWALYTMYANRFDTDDLIFRLSKAAGMLAIVALAVNLPRVMVGHGGAVGFAVGYVVLRVILIALYGRARAHVLGDGRRLCNVLIAGYGCTTLLWLGSVFVPAPVRYLLWCAAMLVDFAIPVRAWAALKGAAVVVSHLTERYGTFFIIVLGEAVIASVTGLSGLTFTFESWAVAAGCLVVALGMWWIYFDLADTSVVGRGVLGLIFVYGQFPLLAGVAAFGEGTKLAILEAGHNGLSAGARWALGGGVSAFALSLALFHLGADSTSVRDRTLRGRIALGSAALALAAAGGSLPPLAFVVVIACAVLGQLLLEARTPRAGLLDPEPQGDTATT
jgi:low temperature requirement protein LtrA